MKHKYTEKQFKWLSYLLLLPISFLLVAVVWSFKIAGNLYVCKDQLPILNFIPPFIHGSQYGDYLLASTNELYGIWGMFIAFAFTLPLYVLTFIGKDKKLLKKIVVATIAIPIVYIIYAFSQSSSLPPASPPLLNIPNADYRIVKLGENYAISYNQDESIMYVGTSKVDLAPFVNQKVTIQGSYNGETTCNPGTCVFTKQQCIMGNCHQLFKGNWDVDKLDIESVTLAR